MGNTYGTLALLFGIIGICCCGIILGPLAIILGAVGMSRDDESTLAVIGLILGLIATICGIIIIVLWVIGWVYF